MSNWRFEEIKHLPPDLAAGKWQGGEGYGVSLIPDHVLFPWRLECLEFRLSSILAWIEDRLCLRHPSRVD